MTVTSLISCHDKIRVRLSLFLSVPTLFPAMQREVCFDILMARCHNYQQRALSQTQT